MGLFIVWIIILDKKRIFEIITYGFFVGTVAIYGDLIGAWFGLWQYPITITPMHLPIEIHRLQMPIIYMMIYQYFTPWKKFLIAATINAFVFAFLLEPFLVWLGIYEPSHWKYIYSLIPYFVIAMVFKWLINIFKQLDQNYQ
ncbi:CBO0543 family protein [Ureibacillus sp. GCM10028918]|uniref:CBO0543 family protein n=1 Tax=Ureibacillus sp. GCM10028918 TaxID=3273429 RepID=UPI003616C214